MATESSEMSTGGATPSSKNVVPERVTREQVIEVPQTKLALDRKFVGKFPKTATVISVQHVEHWIAQNTGAVTVTKFTGGQDGQDLYIVGDGQTTLKHSTGAAENIFLAGGANLLLAANRVYHLKYLAGKWLQP